MSKVSNGKHSPYGMFSGSKPTDGYMFREEFRQSLWHNELHKDGRFPANVLVSGNALDLVKKGESRFFSLDAFEIQYLDVPFDSYCCEFYDDNKKWGHLLFEWSNILYCKKCGVGKYLDL